MRILRLALVCAGIAAVVVFAGVGRPDRASGDTISLPALAEQRACDPLIKCVSLLREGVNAVHARRPFCKIRC